MESVRIWSYSGLYFPALGQFLHSQKIVTIHWSGTGERLFSQVVPTPQR